jgi:hypothetical protein
MCENGWTHEILFLVFFSSSTGSNIGANTAVPRRRESGKPSDRPPPFFERPRSEGVEAGSVGDAEAVALVAEDAAGASVAVVALAAAVPEDLEDVDHLLQQALPAATEVRAVLRPHPVRPDSTDLGKISHATSDRHGRARFKLQCTLRPIIMVLVVRSRLVE